MSAKEKLNALPLRAIALAIFILLLILFNATRRPYESVVSTEFQRVINLYEQQAKAAFEDGKSANKVTISVRSLADPAPINLQVDNVSTEMNRDKTDQVLHLLNLIYESGIINKKEGVTGDFLVHVEINNQVFEGAFRRKDLDTKMPLGIFLKLMQLHTKA